MGRPRLSALASGGPSRLPKSLGLAERSALSRPPPRAAGMPRLSSGGPRAAQARAESRGSPTVDALRALVVATNVAVFCYVADSKPLYGL